MHAKIAADPTGNLMHTMPLRTALADGLSLLLLRAPKTTPRTLGWGVFWCLGALYFLLALYSDASEASSSASFDGDGVQSIAASLLVLLLVASLVAVLLRRPLVLGLANRWLAALLWMDLLLLVFGRMLEPVLADWDWAEWLPLLMLIWLFAMIWTSLRQLARDQAFARVPTALLAGALLLAPNWLWTSWSMYFDFGEDFEYASAPYSGERLMFEQRDRVDRAIEALAAPRPGVVDLYVLVFASDGSENLFRNEALYAQRLFEQRLGSKGRVLLLVNHRDTLSDWPLASASNLQYSLQRLGELLDPNEDLLFSYFSSHGSKDHHLHVGLDHLPLDAVSAQDLASWFRQSAIGARVTVVSACFSGGFLPPMRDPQALLISAAGADRSSFGCGAESEMSWFGRAFLAQALNQSVDFVEAFELARAQVEVWEREEGIEASDPQIEIGSEILPRLQDWRDQLQPGPAVPFNPANLQ